MIVTHGIDIIDVARVATMLEKHGQTFIDRCFTKTEQLAADVSSPEMRAQRFAARYAAKEAVLKALGTGLAGGIEWVDINVAREDGPPMVELSGKAAEVAKKAGITDWQLSLSHTSGIAMASVIGIGGCDG
ncbi:MAG: holo-ACP synthase [Phycisphaerales bacterium]|nr:holo-ACP synthase [Planctomycetota bacterium]MBL6997568.1 holo-ACP synthase [Phycisphaerales bacterium]